MIRYDRLWATMERKGITQYHLIRAWGFSAGQISRMKKNMHVSTRTLETLCRLLDCGIGDLLEYVPDAPDLPKEGSSPGAANAPDTAPKGAPAKAAEKEGKKAAKAGREKKGGKPRKTKGEKKGKGGKKKP